MTRLSAPLIFLIFLSAHVWAQERSRLLLEDTGFPSVCANCDTFQPLALQVERITMPLQSQYASKKRFQLDPLLLGLHVLHSETESLKKSVAPCSAGSQGATKPPWTYTFRVRANSLSLHPDPLPEFLHSDSPFALYGDAEDEMAALGGYKRWEPGTAFKAFILGRNNGSSKTFDSDALAEKFKQDHPDWSHATADQLAAWMEQDLGLHDGFSLDQETLAGQILMERALLARTDAEYFAVLSELKAAPLEKRIQFVQGLGDRLVQNSDDDKLEQTGQPAADGVSGIDLLSNYRAGIPSGVCRDIAPLQAKTLQALGLKNVYVLAFNSFTPHVNVIAQDPDDPHSLYKIDYARLAVGKTSSETGSLRQDLDITSDYYVATPDGKTMAVLPSEIRNTIAENSGANIKDIDYFSPTPRNSVASFTASRGNLDANVFTGALSDGSAIVGIGTSRVWRDPEKNLVSGEGFATYSYLHPRSEGASTSNFHQLYVQYSQHVNSPWLSVVPHSKTRLETTTMIAPNVEVGTINSEMTLPPSLGVPSVSFKSTFTTGFGTAASTIGTHTKIGDGEDKTRVNVTTATQFAAGFKDISDLKTVTVFRNLSYVDVRTERDIDPNIIGFMDLAVGMRQFGPQILASMGVQNRAKTLLIESGYRGALSKDNPGIAPGTQRTLFARGQADFKGWKARIELDAPIDGGVKDASAAVGVSKTIKGRKKPAAVR